MKKMLPSFSLKAMLDDRYYTRSVSWGPVSPATKAILYANTAFFVIQKLLENYTDVPLQKYFYLSQEGIAQGYLFQLVTYQFLHGSIFHLLCNLVGIYFLGKVLEVALGTKDYLVLYFMGGIVGGILQIALGWCFPTNFGGQVIGASGSVFGLVAAFAQMFPKQQITFLLFFVFPISMQAQTLLWIAMAMAVFGIIIPDSNLAHGAHLGGILVGMGYVHFVIHNRLGLSIPPRPKRPRRRMRSRIVVKPWVQKSEEPKMSSEDFISKEIDPILEKISEKGIHSLTEQERHLLESARSRMTRR